MFVGDSYFDTPALRIVSVDPLDTIDQVYAVLYKEYFASKADFSLMIRNAKIYNMPGTVAHNKTPFGIGLKSTFHQ